MELYDVTIIGGGPAGLYSAFYSGMRDLKTKIIEAEDHLGGKLNVFKEKTIWDIGGLPPTKGKQVIAHLIGQAKTFSPHVVLGEQVVDFSREKDGNFLIKTNRSTHRSKAIIIASGYGILRQAKLTIHGAERYEQDNLLYAVTDIERFRNKDVMISGGGNSAVDWANEIEPIAKSVTVIHRRDEFGGHEKFVQQMRQSNVQVMTPFQVKGLTGCSNNCRVEEIEIEHCESRQCERRKIDALIVNHGYDIDLSFMDQAPEGLVLEEMRIPTESSMQTCAPGIFTAGDISGHPGKLPLIAGAFTDAALAVNAVKTYITPEANAFAGVSSHDERLQEQGS
ncbi:NAD(P)/FAD-dependent oxidoreductase [Geomicrobium sp. JCM 19039]|uniref:NAD(P)/FAD-dependent oxidoreductase n=1 Tax=Geomicrobium sp. JCM 19039 TaxID=1460636 RepID=UPI00045F4259|nr:NAD(P)/FAD-dependent oxidoreductase [Geomicrobium sp. JCM 19039]GAK11070.1 thioredoxin reductase [Geomicrobium sp. JCM 19039]